MGLESFCRLAQFTYHCQNRFTHRLISRKTILVQVQVYSVQPSALKSLNINLTEIFEVNFATHRIGVHIDVPATRGLRSRLQKKVVCQIYLYILWTVYECASPAWHKSVLFHWQKVGNPSCPAGEQRQVLQCCWFSQSLVLPWHHITQHCLGEFKSTNQQNSCQITIFLHEINLFWLGVERHISDILSRVVGPHLK